VRRFSSSALVAAALLAWPPAASTQDPGLDELLARATAYVEEFVGKFSRVVAEERYLQEVYEVRMEGSRGTFLGVPQLIERRRLQSDLLLVQTPGAARWLVLRDVFMVDDRPVRDRAERLTRLFLDAPDSATALDRAGVIAREGTRHALRNTGTIDHPLFAIGFLQRLYRERFRFSGGGADPTASTFRIVEFREMARPTIIRGDDGAEFVAIGKVWIHAATGRVVRTEMDASNVNIQARVTTVFAADDGLGIHVPVEMQYRFRRGTLGSELRGTATYGRFRQFEVRTEEKVERP
jgi:hypothetical protein